MKKTVSILLAILLGMSIFDVEKGRKKPQKIQRRQKRKQKAVKRIFLPESIM